MEIYSFRYFKSSDRLVMIVVVSDQNIALICFHVGGRWRERGGWGVILQQSDVYSCNHVLIELIIRLGGHRQRKESLI